MLKTSSAFVREYYHALKEYDAVGATHEGAVSTAFGELLSRAARDEGWTLVPQFPMKGATGKRIRLDGALRDPYGLTLGYWEAKDTDDDLDREIQKKVEVGYPRDNIVYQAPHRAILMQDGQVVFDTTLDDKVALVKVVRMLLEYRAPAPERFHAAVEEFKDRIPELGAGLLEKIREAETNNEAFRAAFERFVTLCRESINPTLSEAAVEEMLIQHLLTERLFRRVFGSDEFARRNPIAIEIERVIGALTSQSFSRRAFLGTLDRFYLAIEDAADTIEDFTSKQAFLNTVYERFFQGFSVKVADTHGIVYTPQPLVDFMVRSVDALLEDHFGTRLADDGVHVLDPFVGTGNFLLRVMEAIPTTRLEGKYKQELHANEVMLLPYYVASLNIEHRFLERVGRHESFPGIVLVDTFELIDGKTIGAFTAENTERAIRQRASPIQVVIGNPPYNAHQLNANDLNQNRKYPYIDKRVRTTYTKASAATNKSALSDPYVKAFRWASDRLGDKGVLAYVTNGSFLSDLAFDGMRKHLLREFDAIYVLDLGGNVRKNPKLSGTTHNVFGIQIGVVVTFLVRTSGKGIRPRPRWASVQHHAVPLDWKRQQKTDWMEAHGDIRGVDWQTLAPRSNGIWLSDGLRDEWDDLLQLGTSGERSSGSENTSTVFNQYSRGVETGRDAWVYDFDSVSLSNRVEKFVDTYNSAVAEWIKHPKSNAKNKSERKVAFESIATHDGRKIKWSESLKNAALAGVEGDFDGHRVRRSLWRPFVPKSLYYDDLLIHRTGGFRHYFPTIKSELENRVIVVSDQGWRSPFTTLVVNRIPDLHLCASSDAYQCFPLYVYNEDGTNRSDNISDWALGKFRDHADDAALTKEDLFHYTYAVLHHSTYRAYFAADLKHSLPHLPLAPPEAVHQIVEAGRQLAVLHLGFETGPEYPLREVETPGESLDWRVEQMEWDDADRTVLRLNGFLALAGIPETARHYRLGNRSALDWLVDQIKVRTDTRSEITHDPNSAFNGVEVSAHVRRVTHLSVETVRIVEGLPSLGLPDP